MCIIYVGFFFCIYVLFFFYMLCVYKQIYMVILILIVRILIGLNFRDGSDLGLFFFIFQLLKIKNGIRYFVFICDNIILFFKFDKGVNSIGIM